MQDIYNDICVQALNLKTKFRIFYKNACIFVRSKVLFTCDLSKSNLYDKKIQMTFVRKVGKLAKALILQGIRLESK